jgi:hypothetical protein
MVKCKSDDRSFPLVIQQRVVVNREKIPRHYPGTDLSLFHEMKSDALIDTRILTLPAVIASTSRVSNRGTTIDSNFLRHAKNLGTSRTAGSDRLSGYPMYVFRMIPSSSPRSDRDTYTTARLVWTDQIIVRGSF